MPDLLAHYAVSFLVASRFFGFRVSAVIALSGLLPDVDALLMVHRWVTHSFVSVLVFGVIVLLVTARLSRPYLAYVAVALSLYSIHIIMDVFTAPTPILWPLTRSSYTVNVNVNGILSHEGAALVPAVSIESMPADFT
ncbi:metal-dependent hydrolase, partial [Candidatus Bathyarchaeota archaeon]|nr:metal-dependent hydrolase [Candidatus Bathyarchaeota archaeon]